MVSRNLVVVCGVMFAVAGCKDPISNNKEVAGPPPRAPETAASTPAPTVTAAATPAASVPACDCAEPAKAALPASIHAAPPAAARPTVQRVSTVRHRSAGAVRRTHSGEGARAASYRARNETTGYDYAEPAGDTRSAYHDQRVQAGGGYLAGERSYEEHTFESEQSSASYQSSHQGGPGPGPGYPPGHGQGGGHAGGGYVQTQSYGYRWGEPGGGYAHPQDYTVSRNARGDVRRSRAWTRVQCGC